MKDDLSSLQIEKEKRYGQREMGKRSGWLLVSCLTVVALLGLSGYSFWWSSADDPTRAGRSASEQEQPKPGGGAGEEAREVLIASGYIVTRHKHELGSKVMGRVAWVGVERGDQVRKGQVLVKLEDREYRAQFEQATADLRVAREKLAALEQGSRPQEIEKAAAELARVTADLSNARLEYRRLFELFEAGLISSQQADNAGTRVEMAEAEVASARQTLDLLIEGPRAEEIRQARAEVQRATAAVDYAQIMLDATEIRAPVNGTALRRIAEVGEMITTSFAGESGAKSAVVVLADLNDLQVELDISQSDFNRVSSELDCLMTPEAYPDRQYRCEVQEVSPEANRQKASIQIKVKILEPDEFLRPEMSARVAFLKKGRSGQ